MGTTLYPMNPTKDAPTFISKYDGKTYPQYLDYNWSNWARLWNPLLEWGVKPEGVSFFCNDEGIIPEGTYVAVADAIGGNAVKLRPEDRECLRTQVLEWEVKKPEGVSFCNDGGIIPEKTCLAVADAIDANIMKLRPETANFFVGKFITGERVADMYKSNRSCNMIQLNWKNSNVMHCSYALRCDGSHTSISGKVLKEGLCQTKLLLIIRREFRASK